LTAALHFSAASISIARIRAGCMAKDAGRDTHLRVRGPLAAHLARQFGAVWAGDATFADVAPAAGHAVVVSNIFRNCHRRFRCLYADLVHMARKTVCLTTPYFVPDPRTQKAMLDAARRGVAVKLLVPYKSDVPIVRWAARALYAGLLSAGVRIFEYQPRMLHAKTATFDEWCAVGSANMDYRSFFLNYELALVARDQGLARLLTDQFFVDLRDAEEVTAAQWRRRPRAEKLQELIGRLVRKWL
jgi:cardiolipin synthase